MTAKTFKHTVFLLSVLIVLFAIHIILLKISVGANDALRNLLISIDLILGVPIIYFFLIRKSSIPKTTVVPVLLVGFFLAYYLVPKEDHAFIAIFKLWILPVIELSVITYVVVKVRQALIKLKKNKTNSSDFFDTLKKTCAEIVPKQLVFPVATEIAVFYYGFLSWKKRELEQNEFSYHKKSGSEALFFGIVLVIAIETYVLHILLVKWSHIATLIVTFLSIYTLFQFIGLGRSLSKRPIKITKNMILMRYGMMNEVEIPFELIENIECSTTELEKEKLTKRFSLLGELEHHNVVLKLKKTHQFQSLYGIKQKFQTLAFFVDEPLDFVEAVEKRMTPQLEI